MRLPSGLSLVLRRKASDERSIPKGFPNSGAASAVRMYCPGVAGWWCARSLPGRRLRGACGGRHSSGLGRRGLHRGHQLGDHRRKRTGPTGCQAASLLAGDHRQPASRLGCRYKPSLQKATCRARSSTSSVPPARSSRVPRASSACGSPLPGCTRTAPLKARVSTTPTI